MRLARVTLVIVAVCAAIVPLPSRMVEAYYSRDFYLSLQERLTPFSNGVSIALLDVGLAVVVIVMLSFFWRRVRTSGFIAAVVRSVWSLLTMGAAAYLLFLMVWGLNYRRLPLEKKLDFDERRVTPAAARSLGEHAARVVNAGYAAAHAPDKDGISLDAAFASAQRVLRHDKLAVPGVPKRSMLSLYFRSAAIDGMTDPYFLEVILNPDVLPFEHPFVLAHEWAHLAGYAHEAEANFLAWLTCMQGNALARYSGWLSIFEHVAAWLPRQDRGALMALLDPGPRQDLADAARRYERASPAVRDTAREVYDTYLRANRVDEGVASYSAVVRLMLGAGLQDYSPGQPLGLRLPD